MRLLKQQRILLPILVVVPLLLFACSLLYPPEIRYSSVLMPVEDTEDPAYTVDEETGAYQYDLGGTTIYARYMTDEELNEMFPDESDDGQYSTNPYTYGNWVDPDLGYTPKRFTVFEVGIINRNFAKMQLDPREAELITDLGEVYNSYTTKIAAARYGNSFENYYKSVRGQSGNDHYRYEMRLGMVRGKNYGLEEMVFRGDSYSGLIAFDPLREDVERVQLVLNDVVYRFDAFDRPSDMETVRFNFMREVTKEVITREMRQAELEREQVRITLNGPRQLVGNRVNDSARSAYAVDRALEANLEQMEQCFMERYREGEVIPGSMVLSFNVEPDGSVTNQNVIEVTAISNENFMNCILDVIEDVQFQPIQDMPAEGDNIVKGPAKTVNVTYPLDFEVYETE